MSKHPKNYRDISIKDLSSSYIFSNRYINIYICKLKYHPVEYNFDRRRYIDNKNIKLWV